MEKLLKRLAAIALLGMTVGGSFGCAYGGIASAPDGSVYVSRNDLILFGLLRKIDVCKPNGTALAGTEVSSPP